MTTTNDHALARFDEPMKTDAEKISGQRAASTAIKNSTNWGQATDVQAMVKAWDTETDNLETDIGAVADLEKKLVVARANVLTTERRWGLRRRGTLAAINIFCDGSKDKIQSFSAAVAQIAAHALPPVPVGLLNRRSRVLGTAGVQWFATPTNRSGFNVQHCTNPADTTTYSTPALCTKRSFNLPGQTPGATIHFRVQALDPELPGGQTAWTAWVPATVTA